MQKMGKAVSLCALAILIAVLLSLLRLAPYCAPTADDFGYGAPVHFTLEEGLGPAAIPAAVEENLRYTYFHWQGTFTSVLLFSIHPGVFSRELYPLTPLFTLSWIVAPLFLALGAVKGMNKYGKLFLGSILSVFCLQCLPSLAEGVYWWNGAAHYLFFWFLSVLVLTAQIRLSRSRVRGWGYLSSLLLCCLGGFFEGGGNYLTALVLPLALATLAILTLTQCRPGRMVAANLLTLLSTCAGLFLSMIAPGNGIRQGRLSGLKALPAILTSFQLAWEDLLGAFTPALIGALLLCVPVFLLSTGKCRYRFRLPFLVLPGAFCALSSLYTPPLFAMGSCDVPRIQNLLFLARTLFLFGSAFYLAGWLRRRFYEWQGRRSSRAERYLRRLLALMTLSGTVTLTICLWPGQPTNTQLVRSELSSGLIEEYCAARDARQAAYEDKDLPLPRYQPIEEFPTSLPKSHQLTWNPDLIVNRALGELTCYHVCGGEVNFVDLEEAKDYFSPYYEEARSLRTEQFSDTFRIGTHVCVPLRELRDLLDFQVAYVPTEDTIYIYIPL